MNLNWGAAFSALLGRSTGVAGTSGALVTIGATPITAGMVQAGISGLAQMIADAKVAVAAKGGSIDADFVVAEDVAGLAALIPVAQPYAGEAKLVLMAANYALDHPSDALQPAMMKAQGQDNVTT